MEDHRFREPRGLAHIRHWPIGQSVYKEVQYEAQIEDLNHSPFLKSFGQFHVASLAQPEASPDKVMLEMLTEIQVELVSLRRRDRERGMPNLTMTNEIASHFPLSKLSAEDFEFAMQMFRKESLARISHK